MPPEALLGFETSDDAAVYRLSETLAGVLTIDFLTPLVDDPCDFGRIAAANALSDIFAMGAKPLVALNILALESCLPESVARDILKGGLEKVSEAGAVVMGGHSIEDHEPKYGLAVFGTVDPKSIVKNYGAAPGDVLYLTKPLGTGIMSAARSAECISEEQFRPAVESMASLNKNAAEAMVACDVTAATDVTGFSFAGHLHEMLQASGLSARVEWESLPFFEEALGLSRAYCRPARTFSIEEFCEPFLSFSSDADLDARRALLCDPQTSGGMLAAIPREQASSFEALFTSMEGRAPWKVGTVCEGAPGTVRVD